MALSFCVVFAVFLALRLGNTSNTMRNAAAVGVNVLFRMAHAVSH